MKQSIFFRANLQSLIFSISVFFLVFKPSFYNPEAGKSLLLSFVIAVAFLVITSIFVTRNVLVKSRTFYPRYLKANSEIGRIVSFTSLLPLFGKLIIITDKNIVIAGNYKKNDPNKSNLFLAKKNNDVLIDSDCISEINYIHMKKYNQLIFIVKGEAKKFKIIDSSFLQIIKEFSSLNNIPLTIV